MCNNMHCIHYVYFYLRVNILNILYITQGYREGFLITSCRGEERFRGCLHVGLYLQSGDVSDYQDKYFNFSIHLVNGSTCN